MKKVILKPIIKSNPTIDSEALKKFAKRPFIRYRTRALNHWLSETGRMQETRRNGKIFLSNSAFMNAYECKWQNLYASKTHNSLFCSMGDFSTNIDDLLTDERLDKINFNNLDEIHTSALFRYYVRILLVTEQIIEDFAKIGLKDKLPTDAKNLREFINSVIKHRVSGINKFHKCNHHIDITFHDFTKLKRQSSDTLSLRNYNVKKTNYSNVLIPKLTFMISTIIQCYDLLDTELAENPSFAAKIKREYTE